MDQRTKSIVGVVLLVAILGSIAYIMRDSIEVLEPVMPVILVTFAALAVAGVSSFLFNLAETKLELPQFMLGGKLTAGGGIAVFMVTLLIMLKFGGGIGGKTGKAVPDITAETNYYFSPWKDPRTSPDQDAEQVRLTLNEAWTSEIMLEARLIFLDKKNDSSGFDVRHVAASLTFPGNSELDEIVLDYECRGSRNDNIVADSSAPWYGCTGKSKQFTVKSKLENIPLVFKSATTKWYEFQESILAYDGDALVLKFKVRSDIRHKDGSEYTVLINCPIPKSSFEQWVSAVGDNAIVGSSGYRVKATQCKPKEV